MHINTCLFAFKNSHSNCKGSSVPSRSEIFPARGCRLVYKYRSSLSCESWDHVVAAFAARVQVKLMFHPWANRNSKPIMSG